MLYMESQGCKAIFRHKVAASQVHPGNMTNGRSLPPGYAIITLDTLAKEMYGTIEMEMTMDDDRSTLAASLGSLVPWRKHNIVLVATVSDGSFDEDVDLTNPMPTPTLPPISETQERPHKIQKISASDKKTATDSNQKNLLCPSKKIIETEQAGTKQNQSKKTTKTEQTGTKQNQQWQFKLGQPLVHLNRVHKLPTKMQALNEWYLNQKGFQIGARYHDKHFYHGEDNILWLKFKELYDFYNVSPWMSKSCPCGPCM